MTSQPMFPDRMLASPAFVRDMRTFLELPAETMLGISKIGDSEDGFAAESQSQTLGERFGLGIDVAARMLRFANHIYDRASVLNLKTDDAIAQIATTALSLAEPVSIDGERKDAIRAILSFNRDYEIAVAKNVTATSGAPHFISAAGAWNVRPVRIRNGEVVKAPVLAMSVVWHDGSENVREAFFQLSESDWADFNAEIASIDENRKDIENIEGTA